MTTEKKPLRSRKSYGRKDKDDFIHRSWTKREGLPADVFDGRPVIGICNTWSELSRCNAGLRDLAEYVKRGVWEARGLAIMVRSGDEILFDGPTRRLELQISPEELTARTEAWEKAPPPPKYSRGYYRLYVQYVLQADGGCDLDFLTGASGSVVDRESH
jgi:dihydroxyacid dehydratase/phosphogluconate dehydratase